jgi:hypothetical protein
MAPPDSQQRRTRNHHKRIDHSRLHRFLLGCDLRSPASTVAAHKEVESPVGLISVSATIPGYIPTIAPRTYFTNPTFEGAGIRTLLQTPNGVAGTIDTPRIIYKEETVQREQGAPAANLPLNQ